MKCIEYSPTHCQDKKKAKMGTGKEKVLYKDINSAVERINYQLKYDKWGGNESACANKLHTLHFDRPYYLFQ